MYIINQHKEMKMTSSTIANTNINIEETFLSELVKNQAAVSVYLKNSIRLKGWLIGADENVLFLKDKNGIQMIYKNLVSTVAPSEMF